MPWINNNLRKSYAIYLGLFWGMTLTLIVIDWRLGIISVAAGSLASGATYAECRGKQ